MSTLWPPSPCAVLHQLSKDVLLTFTVNKKSLHFATVTALFQSFWVLILRLFDALNLLLWLVLDWKPLLWSTPFFSMKFQHFWSKLIQKSSLKSVKSTNIFTTTTRDWWLAFLSSVLFFVAAWKKKKNELRFIEFITLQMSASLYHTVPKVLCKPHYNNSHLETEVC